jgi:hypothetical protein
MLPYPHPATEKDPTVALVLVFVMLLVFYAAYRLHKK